eukprot:TRINITY_DN4064_c1_g2_i5.p3 TRINITY_DN4064_c1_g2~~TRINITY_DN4064_c1_g2_i5.p3  ORF type:complete len:190 (+),score=-8.84 TRINITY_DN4064_c1_g2_i5:1283-1852(+)
MQYVRFLFLFYVNNFVANWNIFMFILYIGFSICGPTDFVINPQILLQIFCYKSVGLLAFFLKYLFVLFSMFCQENWFLGPLFYTQSFVVMDFLTCYNFVCRCLFPSRCRTAASFAELYLHNLWVIGWQILIDLKIVDARFLKERISQFIRLMCLFIYCWFQIFLHIKQIMQFCQILNIDFSIWVFTIDK